MKKRRGLLILLGIVLVVLGWGGFESQPGSHRSNDKTAIHISEQKNNGPDSNSVTTQPVIGESTEAAKQQGYYSLWFKKWLLWVVAWLNNVISEPEKFFAFVIAAFTYFLWDATVKLYKAGDIQIGIAKQTADAADLSAKAAVGQKLPILRCKTPHMWPAVDLFADSFSGTGDPTSDTYIKIIQLKFTNYGETLAYPRQYGLGWMLTERPPVEMEKLPPEPEYSDINNLSHELVIKEDFETPRMITFVLQLDEPTRIKIRDGAITLRLCAFLKYLDFLGNPHEARFCWRWDQGSRDDRYPTGLYRDGLVPETYTRKT